jgi:hypothetical protein
MLGKAWKRRLNSPACGVSTVAPWGRARMALSSSSGCPEKLVKASASSTTARSPVKAASAISCIPRPTPPPGPSTTTLCRGSDSKAVSSAAPSTGRTMTARLAAALTASAARGDASVTRPAPARSAPRAASRAAPVDAIPPDTTTTWPRLYLCPSMRGIGSVSAHSVGTLRNVCGFTSRSTSAPIPISTTRTSPQCSRPGSSRWPGLRRKKVVVVLALTATPWTAPLVPLMPLGRSAAWTCAGAAFIASIMARATPWTGRSRPAPNSASTMTAAPAKPAGLAGSMAPSQRRAASAASPLSRLASPTSMRRTG